MILKKLFYLGMLLLITTSCDKKVSSKEGSIDVFTNIYYNASKGLTDYKQFYISKMDYRNDTIVEFVPDVFLPTMMSKVTIIKNDSFYKPVSYVEDNSIPFMQITSTKPKSVYQKEFGSKWINFPIFDYDKRIEMNDTVLYGKNEYSRFKTLQGKVLTIFYIKKSDTILPYSLSRIADNDYKGRLERIDSYDKEKDIFTTLVLIHRKQMSNDGKAIFNFNKMIDNVIKSKENELKK